MAVNTRVLAASLAAAVVISVGGGYLLSRNGDSSSSSSATTDSVVTITSSGVFPESTGIPTNEIVAGKPLPVVDLTTTTGAKISTADLIGTPLVINVWATTCAPCKREMPALAKVQSDLGDKVRFIGVNAAENTPSALKFASDKGVRYELLSDIDGELQGALGITGLPYTIFVSADGTIVAQKGLELDEATIRSTIQDKLLP
ncbi:MAG: putative thiol-disulfide oxidoreductase [Ilumatobacteraceae bacterium]|nr:putative thiol-disulfide oxidoreductase [Ilumatobacteraceae bacterium]MCU1389429.1 putative thiol-disulfide oxidoreductase [Ilumatobacteraceae bacterium]